MMFLAVEIFIGLFVHDQVIRPYGGDVLVVILLYFLARIFFPEKKSFFSLWIFLFAVFVEATQVIPLADFLGIKNRLLRVIMGTSFAWGDLLAYGMGTAVTFLMDWNLVRKSQRNE